MLQKYPTLLKYRVEHQLDPKFSLVEDKVTGPKIVNKETLSRNHYYKEFDKRHQPGPTTYSQDDRILHEKLRD